MKDFDKWTFAAIVTICYILTTMLCVAAAVVAMSLNDYGAAVFCLALIVVYSLAIVFINRKM